MSEKNRAVTDEQYYAIWEELAAGKSRVAISKMYPISAHAVSDLALGHYYKSLFRTIPKKTVEAVRKMALSRNKRATKHVELKIPAITAAMLTSRPWTTAGLSA